MSNENTPREIDEQIAALSAEANRLEAKMSSNIAMIFHTADARRQYIGRSRTPQWNMSFQEAHDKVSRIAADGADNYLGRDASERLAAYEASMQAYDAKLAEIREVSALYTGWNRFFVVTSSAGHIHSSMSCSTCRPTTTFGWLPYLSGKSQAEAIEHFGPAASALCSVCFPDAPVERQDENLTTRQRDALLAGETPEPEAKKVHCPGSGQQAENRRHRYGKCPHCGYVGAVTQYGQMRKHKEAAH